jgi:hypothetical protein
MINDGWHLVIGADLQEVGIMLIPFADVYGNDLVFQATLFQHDSDLLAVAGGPKINVYQRGPPLIEFHGPDRDRDCTGENR